MARPWPHPATGIYWFRKAVPTKLRPILKKREEKCSLRTRDPDEAKIRHAVKAAEVARQWKGLSTGARSISNKEAVAIAGEFYRRMVQRHQDDPGPPHKWATEWVSIGPDMQGRRVATSTAHYRAIVRKFLFREGLILDEESFASVVRATAKAIRLAEDHLFRNASGDYSPDPNVARFPPFKKSGSPEKTTSIVAAFNAYAGEAAVKAATVKRWKPVINALVSHVGQDVLARISRDNLIAWKDKMLAEKIPPKNRARDPRTVRDVYLAAAKATLQYAQDQGWIANNPAKGIKIRVKRKKKDREKGFDHAEAELILSATLARCSARMSKEMAAARRWAVIGRISASGLTEACAFVVLRSPDVDRAKVAQRLRVAVQTSYPDQPHKRLEAIEYIERIPRTINGKIARTKLRIERKK